MNEVSAAYIPKIQVLIRKRPMTLKEIAKENTDIVEVRGRHNVIVKELRFYNFFR